MKNMKISTRLIVSFMIVVSLMVITGITSIIMLTRVGNALQTFYDTSYHTVTSSWRARQYLVAVRANLLQATIDQDSTRSASFIADTRSAWQGFEDACHEVEKTYMGDKNHITQVEAKIRETNPMIEQLETYAVNNDVEAGYEYLRLTYQPLANETVELLDTIARGAEQRALDRVQSGEAASAFATSIVVIMIVISFVLGIVLAVMISRSIVNPVNEMQQVTLAVSRGDFESKIQYNGKDALGALADNMRNLTATIKEMILDVEMQLEAMGDGNFNIRSRNEAMYVGSFSRLQEAMTKLSIEVSETMAQIDASADTVNNGGDQLTSSVQALAQGSTEQASSIHDLAVTINGISTAVEKTAAHAQSAKEDNQQSHDQIAICSGHMADLMTAMKAIEEKSLEISKVIKTIEDIAFQTNILALNAAVEAARAGAAGKGFAVVADEVRNLATKSQEASQSTATLIEETVRAVNVGSRLSVETDEALKEVVIRAQKVMDAVTEISAATDAQSRDVNQVGAGIDEISSVVQTNSATAEESAAATQILSGQANILKNLVGRFTLRDTALADRAMHAKTGVEPFSPSVSDKY